jgi:hypothetical protein
MTEYWRVSKLSFWSSLNDNRSILMLLPILYADVDVHCDNVYRINSAILGMLESQNVKKKLLRYKNHDIVFRPWQFIDDIVTFYSRFWFYLNWLEVWLYSHDKWYIYYVIRTWIEYTLWYFRSTHRTYSADST